MTFFKPPVMEERAFWRGGQGSRYRTEQIERNLGAM